MIGRARGLASWALRRLQAILRSMSAHCQGRKGSKLVRSAPGIQRDSAWGRQKGCKQDKRKQKLTIALSLPAHLFFLPQIRRRYVHIHLKIEQNRHVIGLMLNTKLYHSVFPGIYYSSCLISQTCHDGSCKSRFALPGRFILPFFKPHRILHTVRM